MAGWIQQTKDSSAKRRCLVVMMKIHYLKWRKAERIALKCMRFEYSWPKVMCKFSRIMPYIFAATTTGTGTGTRARAGARTSELSSMYTYL